MTESQNPSMLSAVELPFTIIHGFLMYHEIKCQGPPGSKRWGRGIPEPGGQAFVTLKLSASLLHSNDAYLCSHTFCGFVFILPCFVYFYFFMENTTLPGQCRLPRYRSGITSASRGLSPLFLWAKITSLGEQDPDLQQLSSGLPVAPIGFPSL